MALSMARWTGKVAVVTGASAGIGVAIVEELMKAGVNVVGLARRKERVEELAKKLKNPNSTLHAFKADVGKEADVVEAFKWVSKNLGPVHILVNNAGFKRDTNLIDGNATMWKEILDTNILGLCIATREAVRSMRANKVDGHIVHMNSISGHYVDYDPHCSVYPASKHAVTALTETLRVELNTVGSKIKISSISPGVVQTEFHKAAGVADKKEVQAFMKTCPKLMPIDVAHAVIFTLSTPPHVQVHELIIKPVGEQV